MTESLQDAIDAYTDRSQAAPAAVASDEPVVQSDAPAVEPTAEDAAPQPGPAAQFTPPDFEGDPNDPQAIADWKKSAFRSLNAKFREVSDLRKKAEAESRKYTQSEAQARAFELLLQSPSTDALLNSFNTMRQYQGLPALAANQSGPAAAENTYGFQPDAYKDITALVTDTIRREMGREVAPIRRDVQSFKQQQTTAQVEASLADLPVERDQTADTQVSALVAQGMPPENAVNAVYGRAIREAYNMNGSKPPASNGSSSPVAQRRPQAPPNLSQPSRGGGQAQNRIKTKAQGGSLYDVVFALAKQNGTRLTR